MADLIKLLIVDDIPETLQNLQKLLAFEPDIQVVATAGNGKEGVKAREETCPGHRAEDVYMPIVGGIKATEMLRLRKLPACR